MVRSFPGDAAVVAAAGTAIGTFGGSLKDVPLSYLATLAKVLDELPRIGGRYALVTMCIGGGKRMR